MSLRIELFTLATEVFREQADKDYIVARSCYRMNLREQFLWESLQACEKYLKGTLLCNKLSARYDPATYDPNKKRNKEFGHDLTRLFAVARTIGDLPLDKPDWLPDFLKYLTTFGNNISRSHFYTFSRRNVFLAIIIPLQLRYISRSKQSPVRSLLISGRELQLVQNNNEPEPSRPCRTSPIPHRSISP